ncbi:MAG: ferritin-like domain-containing protein [Pirellulales bacterium]
MALKNLQDALLEEMQDMLSAEKQISRSLKKLAKKAEAEELKTAFEEHLQQTDGQIDRLEQAFEKVGRKPRSKHCDAMKGILDEGEEMLEEADNDDIRDSLLIASAQKVEHYEIASYGTLCEWAQTLGLSDVAKLLHENLEEEKQTDEKLTKLAKSLNQQAKAAAAE